jgi:hypothetical protein
MSLFIPRQSLTLHPLVPDATKASSKPYSPSLSRRRPPSSFISITPTSSILSGVPTIQSSYAALIHLVNMLKSYSGIPRSCENVHTFIGCLNLSMTSTLCNWRRYLAFRSPPPLRLKMTAPTIATFSVRFSSLFTRFYSHIPP